MKQMIKFLRDYIGKVVLSSIISYILFLLESPRVLIYLFLFVLIWGYILVKYSKNDNRVFFKNVISLSVGNLGAYVVMKFFKGGSIYSLGYVEWALLVVLLVEIFCGLKLVCLNKFDREDESQKVLFKVREYDLERISSFVKKMPIIGVEATWGEGKTFLVEKLTELDEITNEFEIVRIDLLTCRLDEVENIILRELDNVLSSNGIFSRSSLQLRKMLGGIKFLEEIQVLLLDADSSLSITFDYLKSDICKLKKKILLIFDDIERIGDTDITKKIFAIAEKLSGDDIHVLYQYSAEHLDFQRNEVEKYIPHVIHLTKIPFKTLVEDLWAEINKNGQCNITADEICSIRIENLFVYGTEKFADRISELSNLELENVTVRNVCNFLNDIILFSKGKEFETEQTKILIRCLMIRNFMYETYEKLCWNKTIEETLCFKYKNKQITLTQMLIEFVEKKNVELIDEIFADSDNIKNYMALAILDFRFYHKREEIEKDIERRKRNLKDNNREIIANRSISFLREENHNEQINRIIWNVLGNGNSEYSNMDAFIRRLKEEVLSHTVIDKINSWQRLNEDAFYSKICKDNTTLMRFGVDKFLPIFQALRVIGATDDEWISWLEFYFDMNSEKGITVEMIECLNYCDTSRKKVYKYAIERFNQCRIIGNMNNEKSFSNFLSYYISAIFRHGYSDSYEFESWHYEYKMYYEKGLDAPHIIECLSDAKKSIQKERDTTIYEWFDNELYIVLSFIIKCEEIILAEKEIKPNTVDIKTNISSRRGNQEAMDRLQQVFTEDKNLFNSELRRSYDNNLISPRNVREIQNW